MLLCVHISQPVNQNALFTISSEITRTFSIQEKCIHQFKNEWRCFANSHRRRHRTATAAAVWMARVRYPPIPQRNYQHEMRVRKIYHSRESSSSRRRKLQVEKGLDSFFLWDKRMVGKKGLTGRELKVLRLGGYIKSNYGNERWSRRSTFQLSRPRIDPASIKHY